MKPELYVTIIGKGSLGRATLECCADHFYCNPPLLTDADVFWFCEDTPISESGAPDSEAIVREINYWLTGFGPHLHPLVLISSQLPVGTIARLETRWPNHTFAYQPENIRVATASEDFRHQARVVVGLRDHAMCPRLQTLFAPFTDLVIFTTPESAEMTKHTVNAYLGLCIAFANEIARISEAVGANVDDVSRGLKTDRRVSSCAPLNPGKPFGGGHLARDIITLNAIIKARGIHAPLISHILESNR